MPEKGTANLPIDEWLRDEIKIEAAQKKMSMKTLIAKIWEAREGLLLESLSNEKQVNIAPNRPQREPSSERYHDMLDIILRHGKPEIADNLKGVMKVFHEQALLQAESPPEGETKKIRQWVDRKADQKSV